MCIIRAMEDKVSNSRAHAHVKPCLLHIACACGSARMCMLAHSVPPCSTIVITTGARMSCSGRGLCRPTRICPRHPPPLWSNPGGRWLNYHQMSTLHQLNKYHGEQGARCGRQPTHSCCPSSPADRPAPSVFPPHSFVFRLHSLSSIPPRRANSLHSGPARGCSI